MTPPDTPDMPGKHHHRQNKGSYGRGQRAEILAAWALRLKGFRVMARRYACPTGEVDLIIRKKQLVAFVEVKRRDTETAALAALTEQQWRRIETSADIFMARRPHLAACSWRFDAVVVVPRRWPVHYPGIWHP